jgi:hypothetical protein
MQLSVSAFAKLKSLADAGPAPVAVAICAELVSDEELQAMQLSVVAL